MKKLLVLALTATMAMPAYATAGVDDATIVKNILTAPFKLVKKAVKKVAKTTKAIGTELKDIGSDIGEQFAEIVTVPAQAIKDAAQSVKDSEVAQEAADVAGQFAAFPVQIGGDVKDGFNATVDATKTVGRKIADSRFAAKVKGANQVVVDASKKAATNVKNAAKDVMNSEVVEDTKDVLGQFAEAPVELWASITAFFKIITKSTYEAHEGKQLAEYVGLIPEGTNLPEGALHLTALNNGQIEASIRPV